MFIGIRIENYTLWSILHRSLIGMYISVSKKLLRILIRM